MREFFQHLEYEELQLPQTKTAFDAQLGQYITHLWEEGDSRYKANDTVCGLQHAQPNLRRNLPISWQLLKTWGQHELPSRAKPLAPATLNVLCGYLQGSKPQLALALQVAFSALLRSFCSCKLSIYMSGSRRPLCSTWVRLKCRIVMRELMQQRWRTWRFPCCSERGFCVLARTIFWWICARMLFVQPSRVLASRVVLQTAGLNRTVSGEVVPLTSL